LAFSYFLISSCWMRPVLFRCLRSRPVSRTCLRRSRFWRWHQAPRPRFLFRHLRSRGASIKAAAGAAFSGRGRWFCANDTTLRETAVQASATLGQGEPELAAAARRLRKIERSVAKEGKGGLGAALKKTAQPKKRRQKPMRELSPAYRARMQRGRKQGKTRAQARGHRPREHVTKKTTGTPSNVSRVLRQISARRGSISIQWSRASLMVSPPNIVRNRTIRTTLPDGALTMVRELTAQGSEDAAMLALWDATMDHWPLEGAELVSYGTVQIGRE
jgi:hypothetical protein